MASIFTHSVVAGALGAPFARRGLPARFWILGATCAVLPDADVVGLPLGIPFGHMLGHRGLSHSLVFAAALATLAAALCARPRAGRVPHGWLWLYFFLATASHGVLDAMTNGGIGVAFFAPFSDERYFFSFRPIVVSPIGIRPFFSEWGLDVIISELEWVWLPSLVFAAACLCLSRRRLS